MPSVDKNPLLDRLIKKPAMPSPSREVHCFPERGYANVRSFISHLLKMRRPSAILGIVTAIIVDSVKGKSALPPRAHVLKEVFKHLPSVTHLYASSSVEVIPFGFWVIASSKKTVPACPNGMWISLSAVSVFCVEPARDRLNRFYLSLHRNSLSLVVSAVCQRQLTDGALISG